MSIELRLPNITAPTAEGKLQQIQGYLYQVVQDLNWALSTMGTAEQSGLTVTGSGTAAPSAKQDSPVDTFNSIKGLIIKSADIVKAYYDSIVTLIDLNGLYAAQSDFGTFVEETKNALIADDKRIAQQVESLQKIFDENGNVRKEILVSGNIYSGILEYATDGEAIIGLQIGQTTDGFHRFARFTAERLSFYDGNGNESAYISNKTLYIPNASIGLTLTMGGFQSEVLSDRSVVKRWIGGN